MDGLKWKTLLKWMIWGYHHLRKHPYNPSETPWRFWRLLGSSQRPAYVAVPTAMAPYPEFSEAGSMMTLEVQDQTKNSLWDDPYEGFPTTKGQSLVFGLPGLMLKLLGAQEIPWKKVAHSKYTTPKIFTWLAGKSPFENRKYIFKWSILPMSS